MIMKSQMKMERHCWLGNDFGGKQDMQRTLDLTIRLNEDTFEVDVYEPESGEITQMQFPYSPNGHLEFNEQIGAEIYSWISLWSEQMEEDEEDDDDE